MSSSLILMTTYNGEKYIRQQMHSIINQTWKSWRMIIRDDGSCDNTVAILNQYAKKDNRILIVRNDSDTHGAYLNFWTLIHETRNNFLDFDYYFFSDQDDVWELNKLEVMINEADKWCSNKPLLLYADMRVIDQNNNIVYESLNKIMGIGKMSGWSLYFTHGFLWGCDICVNKELIKSIPLLSLNHPYINIMSHDNYFGKYALAKGMIRYIDKPLINHRRHGDNTTGGYSMKLNLFLFIKKAVIQKRDLVKTHARVYNQTLITIDVLSNNQNPCEEYEQIEAAIKSGGLRMTATMWRLKVRRKQTSRTVGLYLIALLGEYKKYLIKI